MQDIKSPWKIHAEKGQEARVGQCGGGQLRGGKCREGAIKGQ